MSWVSYSIAPKEILSAIVIWIAGEPYHKDHHAKGCIEGREEAKYIDGRPLRRGAILWEDIIETVNKHTLVRMHYAMLLGFLW